MEVSISVTGLHGDVTDEAAAHMSIDDAAYRCVHDAPGGAAALAARMGMSVGVLRNKAIPTLNTHVFRPQELLDIQQLGGKHHVLHAMAHALGYVATRQMPDQSGGDPLEAQVRLLDALGEFERAFGDCARMGEGKATPNAVRRAEHHAQLLISEVNNVVATLRGRLRPAPKGDGQ